jgi:hypothetical protein
VTVQALCGDRRHDHEGGELEDERPVRVGWTSLVLELDASWRFSTSKSGC